MLLWKNKYCTILIILHIDLTIVSLRQTTWQAGASPRKGALSVGQHRGGSYNLTRWRAHSRSQKKG